MGARRAQARLAEATPGSVAAEYQFKYAAPVQTLTPKWIKLDEGSPDGHLFPADLLARAYRGAILRASRENRLSYVEQLCRMHRVRAIFLTPHHQFPTTVALQPDRRLRLLELSRQFARRRAIRPGTIGIRT